MLDKKKIQKRVLIFFINSKNYCRKTQQYYQKLKYNEKQKNTTMSELFQTPLDKVIEKGKMETHNTKITIWQIYLRIICRNVAFYDIFFCSIFLFLLLKTRILGICNNRLLLLKREGMRNCDYEQFHYPNQIDTTINKKHLKRLKKYWLGRQMSVICHYRTHVSGFFRSKSLYKE